jgi:uncharacterized protein (TIGR02118 family)
MFKRMSILVRRPQDDRHGFSAGWCRHAALISDLPGVRAYQQNHVVEEFASVSARPLAIDGIVALRFDTPAAMAEAFQSPAAQAMAADEPNFLGHGSGYALATDGPLRPVDGDARLIIALSGPKGTAEDLAHDLAGLSGLVDLTRDDVTDLIPKPGMAPPQPVGHFFHLDFDTAEAASAAGRRLAAQEFPGVMLDIVRVRTITIL